MRGGANETTGVHPDSIGIGITYAKTATMDVGYPVGQVGQPGLVGAAREALGLPAVGLLVPGRLSPAFSSRRRSYPVEPAFHRTLLPQALPEDHLGYPLTTGTRGLSASDYPEACQEVHMSTDLGWTHHQRAATQPDRNDVDRYTNSERLKQA
jgi:hypothetical protein